MNVLSDVYTVSNKPHERWPAEPPSPSISWSHILRNVANYRGGHHQVRRGTAPLLTTHLQNVTMKLHRYYQYRAFKIKKTWKEEILLLNLSARQRENYQRFSNVPLITTHYIQYITYCQNGAFTLFILRRQLRQFFLAWCYSMHT